jgi:hypothetical protein
MRKRTAFALMTTMLLLTAATKLLMQRRCRRQLSNQSA